jgi:hypothetical protein
MEQILARRCFLLFLALLALLVAIPFVVEAVYGRIIIGVLNISILVTAVAAVERSRPSLVIAILLGLPTLCFQVMALQSGVPGIFVLSWGFGAAFYAFTIAHLLHYVLRRDMMTADKLYGAVAAYVMIAVCWAYLYGVLQYFYPGSFAYHGTAKALDMAELIFYSFTVLTTAGFGDVTSRLVQARFATILEAVTGVMYVAILIARLTGVYPVVNPAQPPPATPDDIEHPEAKENTTN